MGHDHEAFMRATTPNEHHRKLDPFVGTWNAAVKHWMAPDAEPSESGGVMTNEWTLDGRFLKQNYDAEFMGMKFQGEGYWGFNNVTGKYEGVWLDTMSTWISTDAGDVDDAGKRWEMSGELADPSTGKPMRRRSVITIIDEDHHVMEMFMGGPENEFRVMEIQYERA